MKGRVMVWERIREQNKDTRFFSFPKVGKNQQSPLCDSQGKLGFW